MDYKVKKSDKSVVEISVTISDEEMGEHRKKAADEISRDVKIDGFRPGHVPLHVLEKVVDKKIIESRAQELAIQKSYAEVIIKEKIQVIARPKVKIEKESPLSYIAEAPVMPEVGVEGYQDIKVEKKDVKVTDKDVEEVLKDLKKHGMTYKDVDRKAKKGDRVEVDFEGFDEDGKSVENTKSEKHPVIIGEQSLIPGFEEELVGLKKGEKKEFDLTFPNDYHKKDFQNKKLKFKVEVKSVKEPQEPNLTEEYIEKLTGKKQSPDDLKKEIKENVKAKKEQEEKTRQENEYAEKLLKKVKVEVPEALIEEEVHSIIHQMKDDISQKGLEFDQFLKQMKTTEEDLKKKYHGEAERRIKLRLAIQHLIEKEKIDLSEDEIKAELEKIKSFYPQEQHEKIQEDFEKGELKNQIINRLLLRKFFQKVLK